MRVALFVILVLLNASPGLSQNQRTGLDKIAVYSGDWNTTIVHKDTDYSKAGSETTHLHNDCWRSSDFYVCHQIVDGKSVGLVIFVYDPKADQYTTYNVPPGGGAAGSGTLSIKGDTWTFPWSIKNKAGETVYFRVVNEFRGPDTIDYRQEFSIDQTHWTIDATGRERRVAK